MNLKDKMDLLESVKANKEIFEGILEMDIDNLAVNRLFFSDNETIPTIYLITKEETHDIDLAIEKKLMDVIDNVVFDIVNEDYYKTHIANTSQTF